MKTVNRHGLTVNPLSGSTDRSVVVDFEATNRRELTGQAAGAPPGTTDQREDGAAVARVRKFRRYRSALRGAACIRSVYSLTPVKLDIVDGVERGAWIGSDVEVYITAAQAMAPEDESVAETCDVCNQRHGRDDPECDGMDESPGGQGLEDVIEELAP